MQNIVAEYPLAIFGAVIVFLVAISALIFWCVLWLIQHKHQKTSQTVLQKAEPERQPALEEALSKPLADFARQMNHLCSRLEYVEQQTRSVIYPPAEAASPHLGRQAQVIQLHRTGASPREIAAGLRLSQGEVKLIIKMHELVPAFSGTAAPELQNGL